MRLILKLKAKNQIIEPSYNRKFQSFLYDILRNTEFFYIHDIVKYKHKLKNIKIPPFCFSNLFPYGNMKIDQIKNIIVSSPDANLILALYNEINKIQSPIHLGRSIFLIDDCKIFNIKIKRFNISTGTPIIIRIPQYVYESHEIIPKHPYRYIFWKKEYPLEIFINQLEMNLEKKYFNYYNVKPSTNLFKSSTLIFKKQVSHQIWVNGSIQTLIGTLWDFWLDDLDLSINMTNSNKDDLFKLLQFTIEAGLGERNSLGYGFVNPL